MATVMVPSVPRHPISFDKAPHKVPPSRPTGTPAKPASSSSDPYYGHEASAKLCARFVTHLFACPEYPPIAAGQPPPTAQPVHLAGFVAYALHRTRLHQSVTFAALYLLQRLKQRFPAARGSSGHRLFLSAFMIASKVICDDTYSNKSWCIVGQGMFALREVNQMEREMCAYLDWELNVDPDCLREFERAIRTNFSGPGPYKAIPLPLPPSKTASAPAVAPAPYTAPPEQATITVVTPTAPAPTRHTSPSHRYSPESPETPGSSRSMGSSPANSPGPRTPESIEEVHAKIAAAGQSPPYGEPRSAAAGIKAAAMVAALQREPGAPPHVGVVGVDMPSKPLAPQRAATGKTFLLPGKTRAEAFAFANPALW